MSVVSNSLSASAVLPNFAFTRVGEHGFVAKALTAGFLRESDRFRRLIPRFREISRAQQIPGQHGLRPCAGTGRVGLFISRHRLPRQTLSVRISFLVQSN